MGQLDWVQLVQKPDPEIWQGWVSEAAARKNRCDILEGFPRQGSLSLIADRLR
jgi:hypothetical protein